MELPASMHPAPQEQPVRQEPKQLVLVQPEQVLQQLGLPKQVLPEPQVQLAQQPSPM